MSWVGQDTCMVLLHAWRIIRNLTHGSSFLHQCGMYMKRCWLTVTASVRNLEQEFQLLVGHNQSSVCIDDSGGVPDRPGYCVTGSRTGSTPTTASEARKAQQLQKRLRTLCEAQRDGRKSVADTLHGLGHCIRLAAAHWHTVWQLAYSFTAAVMTMNMTLWISYTNKAFMTEWLLISMYWLLLNCMTTFAVYCSFEMYLCAFDVCVASM